MLGTLEVLKVPYLLGGAWGAQAAGKGCFCPNNTGSLSLKRETGQLPVVTSTLAPRSIPRL